MSEEKENKAPAFQWYPKDILGSQRVQLMDLKIEGAYRRAIDYCWLHGSLPNDAVRIAKIVGKKCTVKMAEEFMSMFYLDGGVLKHDRLEEERMKQKIWREKSSNGGKKSAEKRKQSSTTVQPPLEGCLQNGINQKATLQSSSSSSSSNTVDDLENFHAEFLKAFISEEKKIERDAILIQLGQRDFKHEWGEKFNAHLVTEGKKYAQFHPWMNHLRNWLTIHLSVKRNSKTMKDSNDSNISNNDHYKNSESVL